MFRPEPLQGTIYQLQSKGDAMEKRLYKSSSEKMIAGVAGGLAEYFGIDPVLSRILFVALVFLHGIGVIAYVLLWIIMPKRPASDAPASEPLEAQAETAFSDAGGTVATPTLRVKDGKGSLVIGTFLIVLGGLFFLGNVLPNFCFDMYWPLLLIALGTVLLWPALKKN
ncbi:MAG: PspC domain-containing protein [Ignavibacteriae bacterium]|nr:PspC domain-containing protein [Ignavibacteriota bacterium]